MINKNFITSFLLATAIVTIANAAPLGAGFTYQGELQVSGVPANGEYDLQFELLDAATFGALVATPVIVEDVSVSNGVFSVELDFGFGPFAGDQLWLEIGVREGASAGGFTGLLPRQKLTATPYALHAEMVAAGAIASLEIANDSIAAADISSNAVGSSELANNAVDTVAIQDNAVTASKLAANSVGSSEVINESLGAEDLAVDSVGTSEIIDASVGSADIIASQVQRRISGACGAGTYLSGINQDGSVQCSALLIGLVVRPDTADTLGFASSIAIRADGLPIISYLGTIAFSGDTDLMVFDCSNPICSAGTPRTLDSVGNVGDFNSMAIRSDGLPIISYFDDTNDDLKIYACSNPACSAGEAFTLDSTGFVGQYSSIAIRADGLPIISYFDDSNDDLKVYDCGNPDCSMGMARTLDSAGIVGRFGNSIAIRDDGLPIISYYDDTNDDLKVFACSNPTCTAGMARILDSSVPGSLNLSVSIAIRGDGLPIISYYNGFPNRNLNVYDCSSTSCSTGSVRILDGAEAVGEYSSVAIGTDGLPIISYYDNTNDDLKIFNCSNLSCSQGSARILDSLGSVGEYTDVAIRDDGRPIIVYSNSSNGILRVYSCGDSRCEN